MSCPLRALALAAAIATTLALGTIPLALAQSSAPPAAAMPQVMPDAPPPPPALTPAQPGTRQNGDPFGEETVLTAKTIIFLKGNGTWDTAFDTLVDAYKSVYAFLEKQGVKPAGPPMTIYTQADDTGFTFQASVPVTEPPTEALRGDMAVGKSPAGRALKFVHRGNYDSMDTTYEAITNHLDEKQLEAQDTFIEEYVTDPLTTAEDKLIINVFVPIK